MKYCIWCFAPSDTKNSACPAPDGDGHLFSLDSASPPTEGELFIPTMLNEDDELNDWRPY